eukprot:909978-Pleurochrysis_carterae.AAC.1
MRVLKRDPPRRCAPASAPAPAPSSRRYVFVYLSSLEPARTDALVVPGSRESDFVKHASSGVRG